MTSLPLGLGLDFVHEAVDGPRERSSRSRALTVAEQAKLSLEALEAQAGTPKKSSVQQLKELAHRNGCSSALRAWFHHFDKDQSYRIDYREFDKGLKELKFGGQKEDCVKLWQELDEDNSGEISFEEFAEPQEATLWNQFRHFCGASFQGAKDMIHQMQEYYADVNVLDPPTEERVLHQREFEESLPGLGWTEGEETLLWEAFCSDSEGHIPSIYAKNIRWVDREVKIFKMKQAARKKAEKMAGVKQRTIQEAQLALKSFKAFMKKQFGNSFRAWRQALDLDGSMNLQRAELFKAVKALNWKGNCRALWKALDHDQSGITTIEEFDPDTAQVMAYFREWAISKLSGSKRPSDVFEVLDRNNRKKLSRTQFQQELESQGYTKRTKSLIHMLDWQDKKYICIRDLTFLDIWRPPAFLTGTPDPQAAESFKKQLVARHGHILKAWRFAMDKDGSNSCNWHEFQEAAKLVRFRGNLASVWLALDADMSGAISLKEIDEDANECLVQFKQWADSEFGGVRSAFKVLDNDASGSLNFKEFKAACRSYGFPGDCKMLFQCLDQQGEGALQPHEVFFLDKWMLDDPAEYGLPDRDASDKRRLDPDGDRMLEYFTDTPGPGQYTVPESLAQKDSCPIARHCGSFTMQRRYACATAKRAIVSPAKYSPSMRATAKRQPAWNFTRPKSARQPTVRVTVAGLSEHVTDRALKRLFEPFGRVLCAGAQRVGAASGRCCGTGFVKYGSLEEATKAVAQMHRRVLNDQILHIDSPWVDALPPNADLKGLLQPLLEDRPKSAEGPSIPAGGSGFVYSRSWSDPEREPLRRPCGPGPGSYDLQQEAPGPRYSMRPRRALPLHPHCSPREMLGGPA